MNSLLESCQNFNIDFDFAVNEFWARMVKPNGEDGCWYFPSKHRSYFSRSNTLFGQSIANHRISWILANKSDVPEGKLVYKTCRNSDCCNPEHIKAGTNSNISQTWIKDRKMPNYGYANTRRLYKESFAEKAKFIYKNKSLPPTVIWGIKHGYFTLEQATHKIDYYAGRCYICRDKPIWAFDHVIPRAYKSIELLANLKPVCHQCNSGKGGRFNFAKLKVLLKHFTNFKLQPRINCKNLQAHSQILQQNGI